MARCADGITGLPLLDPISARFLENAGHSSIPECRGPVVLMYHGVDPDNHITHWKWSLPISLFASHMRVLKRFGWVTLKASDLVDPTHLPTKAVVITFDDGYQNNYELAFPILQELGMKATWFVVTRRIGKKANWPDSHHYSRPILTYPQLLALSQAGMEIAAHTRTHADLSAIPEEDYRSEIHGAKADLEDLLGKRVVSFAYPNGRFTDKTVAAVDHAGYAVGFTTNPGRIGTNWKVLETPRIAVFRYDTAARFARKIAFADTNIGWPQIIRSMTDRLFARI